MASQLHCQAMLSFLVLPLHSTVPHQLMGDRGHIDMLLMQQSSRPISCSKGSSWNLDVQA